jgi:hypothetical protein
MSKPFLSKEELQDTLVAQLPTKQRELYESLRHARSEACFRGRLFVIYEMVKRECKVLDTLEVLDFQCDHEAGASMEVLSRSTGRRFTVGYAPAQVLDYPIFMFMPLYLRVRWCADADQAGTGGHLGFDVVLRTKSRYHLRERQVIYCESRTQWMEEFGAEAAAQA